MSPRLHVDALLVASSGALAQHVRSTSVPLLEADPAGALRTGDLEPLQTWQWDAPDEVPGTRIAAVQDSKLQAAPEPMADAPMVAEVELELPPGTDTEGLASLVSVQPGRALSPRELRRSIEQLWRSGRFSMVEVRAFPTGDGALRIVFRLTPVPVVVGAAVEGNRALGDEAILEAAGFRSGGRDVALDGLEEAAERVRRLYASKGFESAQVTATAQQVATGVELLLRVVEGPATLIRSVELEGVDGIPVAGLREALGVRPLTVLDRQRLDAGLERLRRRLHAEGYRSARVDRPIEERVEGMLHLRVPVHPGPLWEFRFIGNQLVSDEVLGGAIDRLVEDPESEDAVSQAVERLEGLYRARGFVAADVGASISRAPDGSRALLTFHIHEDLPWRLRSLEFRGRYALSDAELRTTLAAILRSRSQRGSAELPRLQDPLNLEGRVEEASQPPPLPDASEVWSEEAWREAADQLTQLYRGRGYLSARVMLEAAELDYEARTVAVRFAVTEGPLTRLEFLSVDGLPEGMALPKGMPRQGAPFTPAIGERGRETLDAALAKLGYVFARVEGRAGLSEDGTRASLTYEVTPGPLVRVGNLLIQGLVRSDPELVRGQVSLQEGAPLDPDQLRVTQRNLLSLGHFRQVAVRPVAPEVREPVKDVLVEVRERPRAEGRLGLGYFLAEGPRVTSEVDFPNLFQSGFTFQSRLRANYVALSLVDSLRELQGLDALGGQLGLSLVSPRVATPAGRFGTRVDAVAERVFRPAFTFNRLAGVLGAELVRGWFSVVAQGELEIDDVDTLGSNDLLRLLESSVDPERARFPNGRFALWATRLTATADFRDDPANTRSGALLSMSGELMDDFFAFFRSADGREEEGTLRSLKLSANLTGYVPLGSKVVLAASLRGGHTVLLSPDSETIAPRRFFLGGWASMRGFREDGVLPADLRSEYRAQRNACRALANPAGCTAAARLLESGNDLRSEGGNQFVLGKLELRVPLVSELELGLFAEAGNLWLNAPSDWSELQLRYVTGAGLRLRTPVGPVAFDVGLNLDPDRDVNEQAANVHFSIGLF